MKRITKKREPRIIRTASYLALFFFMLLGIYPSRGFSQGAEWQRLRMSGGVLPKQQDGLTGEGAPVEYFVARGDALEIFVWQNEDISKDVRVGPDGKISLPLIKRIQAAGLTIEGLERAIEQALAKYIRYPNVSIMVKEFGGEKIIILGEVEYPGIYTYSGVIDLVEALALAGDFTEEAREDSVMIVRGNLTETPDVQRINLRRILRQGTSQRNIILQPRDVIFIPKSYIANFNKFLDNITPSITEANDALTLRKELRRLQGHER